MNKKKLLLHTCCAPDATTAIERLRDNYDITVYFYNPCIQPEDEYEKREKDARYVADIYGAGYVSDIYDAENFLSLVKGLEDEPEKGKRCLLCYKMRLLKCAGFGSGSAYDCFTTTLTVSPHKNSDVINNIGREIAKEHNIEFLELDLKKQDGFKKSLDTSKKLNLYRQNYCGCIFSKNKKGAF
ncbi:MAG: epoxyqueuosine reductase QueH [Armatimonadota bacterium]